MKRITKDLSYREKVYEELKIAITEQVLLPGSVLNERKIAEQLSVSRTPVREAMQMLETEGWVTILPRRGFFVNPITIEEVQEICEARRCIECFIVKEIASKISDEHLQIVMGIFQQQKQLISDIDQKKYAHFDSEFHMFFGKLLGNKSLIRWQYGLREKTERISMYVASWGNIFEKTIEEHQNIICALQGNDAKRAVEAMRDHLTKSEQRIVGFLKNKRN